MEESVNVLEFAECRASEIFSLVNSVSRKENKLSLQKVPHHMRRRAASHNPKRVPRSLRNLKIDPVAKSPIKHKKNKNRKHKKFLKECGRRQRADSMWLPTHMWFAKRFHIQKMWGYKLPIHSNDKRARAAYRAAANCVLLQDLSYYCCIELSGSEGNLLTQLVLLNDESTGTNFASESFLDGTKEGLCYVYHPGSFPYKAIGLVSFLWKPLNTRPTNSKTSVEPDIKNRQLWIWSHPSFYDELVKVFISIFNLKELVNTDHPSSESKCEMKIIGDESQHMENSEKFHFSSKVNYEKVKHTFQKELVYCSDNVKMMLLKNTLVRQRLIGPRALSLITHVLKPVGIIPHYDKDVDVKEMNKISWNIYCDSEEYKTSYSVQQNLWKHLSNNKSLFTFPPRSVLGLTVKDPRLYWLSKRMRELQDCFVEETNSIILDEFFTPAVANSPLWEKQIRDEVTAGQISEDAINKERAKYILLNDLSETDFGKTAASKVPVIVIQQPGLNNFANGFDVILPQGWSMAFWIPFVLGGAQAAGLKDLHSTNFEIAQPSFPISFPDTRSGKLWMDQNNEENMKRFNKYSKSKRPDYQKLGVGSPFYMPYPTLVNEWMEDFHRSQGSLILPSNMEQPSDIICNISGNGCNNAETIFENCPADFYVLRLHKEIMCLKLITKMLSKMERKCYSVEELQNLEIMYKDFIRSVVSTKKEFSKALVLVKIKCSQRGVPTQYSRLYLPNQSDLILLKNNPKLFDLVEPSHCLEKVSNFKSKKNRKKFKRFKSENEAETKSLSEFDTKNLVDNSRKIIGYISEGGFSYLNAHGCGIGHCVLIGFLVLLKNCLSAGVRPTVLFREQHTFHYRTANIEVIDHSL